MRSFLITMLAVAIFLTIIGGALVGAVSIGQQIDAHFQPKVFGLPSKDKK